MPDPASSSAPDATSPHTSPDSSAADYPAIQDHGVIGDLRTVALVSLHGCIDYMCHPRFDSPTIFAGLLDAERGGCFAITPRMDNPRRRQIYIPDTNILLTRFLSAEGVAEISDFMPVDRTGRIVRRVKVVYGRVDFRLDCSPRPDYGRQTPEVSLQDGHAVFHCPGTGCPDAGYTEPADGQDRPARAFLLRTPLPLRLEADGSVSAEFSLSAGEKAYCVFESVDGEIEPLDEETYVAEAFKETSNFWRDWLASSRYTGRWREMVHRSALLLKLLTSRDFGSMVAAPTFGLPEVIGGQRNWDYRFTWVRDAAFTLYALLRLGFTDEVLQFQDWLHSRTQGCSKDGSMQVVYGVDGHSDLSETALEHLSGYRDSKPVLIGNAAHEQLQLDIYGELVDAIYLAAKRHGRPHRELWRRLIRTVDYVCANWQRADRGIWEVRGPERQFLSSRLMCWVALDRALRMAERFSLPCPVERWRAQRDAIHESIFSEFWDEELGAFAQYPGAKAVDASVLLMPLMRFIHPRDPYWLRTMAKVKQRLLQDCLVLRYDNQTHSVDGLEGMEATFTTCAFWYVECLARSGDVQQARFYFEKVLSYANHVGLYAEELSHAGQHLGNFPQALTHLALISAAYALNRSLDASDPEVAGPTPGHGARAEQSGQPRQGAYPGAPSPYEDD